MVLNAFDNLDEVTRVTMVDGFAIERTALVFGQDIGLQSLSEVVEYVCVPH